LLKSVLVEAPLVSTLFASFSSGVVLVLRRPGRLQRGETDAFGRATEASSRDESGEAADERAAAAIRDGTRERLAR
jgi:hypothetical protein